MLMKFRVLLYYVCLIFLLPLLFLSLFNRAYYNDMIAYDKILFLKQHLPVLLLSLAIIFFFFFFLLKLSTYLNKYNPSYILFGILTLSFTVKVIFILLFPTQPDADMKYVLDIGEQFAKGNYSALNPGYYIGVFAQNLGITLLFSMLFNFFPFYLITIKMLNVLLSTITAYLIFLIYRELKFSHKEEQPGSHHMGILILSAFFLPSIFMNNIIYNDVIATCFFTGAVYFIIRFKKDQKLYFIILCGLLLSIGNLFRTLGILFLVSFIIYLLANIKNLKFVLIGIVVLLLTFKSALFGATKSLELSGILNQPIDKTSMPVYNYIYMGMDPQSLGFWDFGRSYSIYFSDAISNKELAVVLYKQKIIERIKSLGFTRIAGIYAQKTFWIWTEGTYQVNTYGIGYSTIRGGYLYKTFAQDLIKDISISREVLGWFIYCFNLFMLFLFAFGTLNSLKKNYFQTEILILIVLAFVSLYIVWEVKSRYTFCCYPFLLILAYMGWEDISQHLSFIKKEKNMLPSE